MDEHRANYPDKPVKTGRRLAVNIDSPRDRTVCFMVSEEEKQAIDEIGVVIGRTRSAVLTRIVTSFVSSAFDDSGSADIWDDLTKFRDECRIALTETTTSKTRTKTKK